MAIKSNQHVIKTKNYCNNYMLGNRILSRAFAFRKSCVR